MAANAIAWPAALVPQNVEFHPENQSRSGGLSMTGSEQLTISNAGRWRASVRVVIRDEARNLALRQFVAQMDGRAGTVLVPVRELFRPRDMNGRKVSPTPAVGYSCNDFNFDLSGFGQTEAEHAALATSATLGATQVSVNLTDGEGPRPGDHFGFDDRVYRCQSVWQVTEGLPTQIRFWPRLRKAMPASSRVILDRPVCLMRFADDNAGQAALNRAGSGVVTMEFVEAI